MSPERFERAGLAEPVLLPHEQVEGLPVQRLRFLAAPGPALEVRHALEGARRAQHIPGSPILVERTGIALPRFGHFAAAQLNCAFHFEHARVAAIIVAPGQHTTRLVQPHAGGVQKTELDLRFGRAHHQLPAREHVGRVLRRQCLLQGLQRGSVVSGVKFEGGCAPQHPRLPGAVLQRGVVARSVCIGCARGGPALRTLLQRAQLLPRRGQRVRGLLLRLQLQRLAIKCACLREVTSAQPAAGLLEQLVDRTGSGFALRRPQHRADPPRRGGDREQDCRTGGDPAPQRGWRGDGVAVHVSVLRIVPDRSARVRSTPPSKPSARRCDRRGLRPDRVANPRTATHRRPSCHTGAFTRHPRGNP